MPKKDIPQSILDQLAKLEQKYQSMGQDMTAYLDGLLYSNFLTYWDYIHLETLLSLQNPKTDFADEKIFITYHQITELYFNLILHEIEQITSQKNLTEQWFIERLKRMINYFKQLVNSFEIMGSGMDKEQFLKYRMALLPASGFQSVQYRMIEICSTDLINIVAREELTSLVEESRIDEIYEKLYWKKGATELATGQKTLTLQQFEKKYSAKLIKLAYEYQDKNLWQIFQKNFPDSTKIAKLLHDYDALANIEWASSHLKSAMKYLQKKETIIAATGGTNWQKYLPPKYQQRRFFPLLWSEDEINNWGKQKIGW
ncbi:MAG: tryptophan 2,3-dioxygenase [Bacteroidetes bacterium]|nr:MAG: tryptophan 2,3-dioxygenase [Bacteroidota bacterium]